MSYPEIEAIHNIVSFLKQTDTKYCKSEDNKGKEASHKYFAFNNPKLEMITGGAWELSLYPHLPYKYKPKNVVLTYYIEFNDNIFEDFVDEIVVNSREEIVFKLKCGLSLKERLVE